MLLYVKVSGVDFEVEADVEEKQVIDVYSVSAFNGKEYIPLNLKNEDLDKFLEQNIDALNEAYEDYEIAMKEIRYDAMREGL